MLRKLAALIGFAAFALCSSAQAVTFEYPASDQFGMRMQQWANEAHVPTAPGTVRVVPQNCTQFQAQACTTISRGQATMFMPDDTFMWTEPGRTDGEREKERLLTLHELGHVFDFTRHRHFYRLDFMRIMRFEHQRREDRMIVTRLEPHTWLVAFDEHEEVSYPDEEFAEAYSFCAAGYNYAAMKRALGQFGVG